MTNLNKEIQGFYPYWTAIDEYTKLRMDLLSTIVWCQADAKKDGTFQLYGNDPIELIVYSHDRGVKVVLMLTSESSITDIILSDTNIRYILIKNLLNYIQTKNFDGIDIDIEGTNKINTITNVSNKSLMTDFITELVNTFRKINSNYRISIDLPSVDWNDIWDMATLQNKIDYAMIMGYDYHWQTSPVAGSVSPIVVDPSESPSISNSIKYYTGIMNKNKLLLGIPYYGYKYSTIDNIRLSPTTADGIGLGYNQIIIMPQILDKIFDNIWKTPWFVYQSDGNWYQVHYDDVQSLGIKYDLVNSDNLAGIGIWALGYDSGRNELWNLIQQKFISCSIKVTAPSMGLIYKTRESRIIRWVSAGNIGANVKIQLLKTGAVVKTISTSTSDDGSFTWTIPSVPRNNSYQIKIISATNSSCIGVSGKFTIK